MKPITARQARALCTHVTKHVKGYPSLEAFGATGEVCVPFLREIRLLETAKATLLNGRRITHSTYWDIVSLSVFAEFHADDGFHDLRKQQDQAAPS